MLFFADFTALYTWYDMSWIYFLRIKIQAKLFPKFCPQSELWLGLRRRRAAAAHPAGCQLDISLSHEMKPPDFLKKWTNSGKKNKTFVTFWYLEEKKKITIFRNTNLRSIQTHIWSISVWPIELFWSNQTRY